MRRRDTCQVHILWGGPQLREGVLGHLVGYGQEVEDAAPAIVHQHHRQRGPHLACTSLCLDRISPSFGRAYVLIPLHTAGQAQQPVG